jgi:hypothetical protein
VQAEVIVKLRLCPLVVALSLSVLCPSLAAAQAASGDLAGLVKNLLDLSTVNTVNTNTDGKTSIDHRDHFLVGESLKLTTRELNVALAEQLSSFPLSSSSGGFSFRVNKDGSVVPASTTFGPAFAERALTIGKGKVNFGFSFQSTSYESFEGMQLDSGAISFIREHNDCCPMGHAPSSPTDGTPAFERDLLQSNLRLTVDTKTTAFFANYGVTDHLDVGVAIPIAHVEMNGAVDGTILRLGSGDASQVHEFNNLQDTETITQSGSATGLGDILIRAKYNFFRNDTTALAGALDLRLPTGDKDNLLGTGATQTNFFFVASGEYGIFSPHVNIGYTFSNGTTSAEATSFNTDPAIYGNVPSSVNADSVDLKVPDEFNYVVGVAAAVHPRVTVGFDLRGRNIRDVPRFDLQNLTFPTVAPPPTHVIDNKVSVESTNGNLNLLLGIVGAKFNIGKTLLLNASVLFAMNDNGLKPKPTPVIGFDYVF